MGRMSPRPTSPFSGPAQQGLNLMDSSPLALDGLAASLAQVTADLQSSGDEWDVPPGIQVTRREFHHAVSQAARDLGVTQVGGDRISPLELSPSYLARRDDSSEVLSTHANCDDTDWRYRPPSRQSRQSQLSTSSLRDLMGELVNRLGQPFEALGRSIMSRLRPGRRTN